MATTNFLAWDAPSNNAENDAQYANDSMRINGAPVGAILPSAVFNKFAKQQSIFVAAFAEMLVAKGYSTNDVNQGALAGVLSNLLTTADQLPAQIQVPYSPTPVFDCSKSNGFRIDLAGNVSSSSLINMRSGQIVTFFIVSGAPGTYTFAWPTNVNNPPNVQTQSISNLLTAQFITDGGNFFPLDNFLLQLQIEIDAINSQIGTINGSLSTINGQVSALQSGKQNNLGFTPVQQGGGAGQGSNKIYTGWSGARLKAQVDSTDLGNIVFDGDLASALSGLISSSASGNGWLNVGGIILQWVTGSQDNTTTVVTRTLTFPRSFPTMCFAAFASTNYAGGNSDDLSSYQVIGTPSQTQVTVRRGRSGSIEQAQITTPLVWAVGV